MSHHARRLALVAALLVSPAMAHAGSIEGVEGTLNTIFQKQQTSFSGIGMRLHVTGPESVPGMTFVPTLQYWISRNTLSAFGIRSSRSDAMLGMETRYTFKSASLQPYMGAGFGIHFFHDEVTTPATGTESQTLSKGALALLGGISMPLAGSLHNDFGAQYVFAGDRAQFKIDWGFRYSF